MGAPVAKNYYEVLGIAKNAGADEIKKAYRKLALEFHPDRNKDNPAAETKFKEISEAYAVLSDPDKKKQYDAFGHSGFREQYSAEDIFRGADFSNIFNEFGMGGGDFFSRIFGGLGGMPFGAGGSTYAGGTQGRRRAGPREIKGQDIEYHATISFLDAYNGASREFNLSLPSGESRQISVKIPAGINTGGKLRIAGKGLASPVPGGRAGDLFIIIQVSPDPQFTRKESDIEVNLPLKLSEALLGSSAEVNTPKGTKTIKVPPGMSPGKKIRLRGLGFPKKVGAKEHGDLFAVISLTLPQELNEEQIGVIKSLVEVGL